VVSAADTSLTGWKEICDFMRKSQPTMRKLIRKEGFPACIVAGEWISDTQLIQEWRRERIAAGIHKEKLMPAKENTVADGT
jgi:hypothetical protein